MDIEGFFSEGPESTSTQIAGGFCREVTSNEDKSVKSDQPKHAKSSVGGPARMIGYVSNLIINE